MDAVFKDENGKHVRLGDYFSKGKPVILALVYYECPMLCNEVLNGLTGSLKGLNFSAGEEFEVVAISFDARENSKTELAKNKKAGYLQRYNRPETDNGWHFLTGEQAEIDKVTEAVGFNYAFDEKTNQFAHAGGIMVATPEGRLSRYLYGSITLRWILKFSIMESSQNKIGNPAEQLYLYCYHYDPSDGKVRIRDPERSAACRRGDARRPRDDAVCLLAQRKGKTGRRLSRQRRTVSAGVDFSGRPGRRPRLKCIMQNNSWVPLFPDAASSFAWQVDALYFYLIAISLFFTVIIVAAVIAFRDQIPRA